jgi:hypothetical protein
MRVNKTIFFFFGNIYKLRLNRVWIRCALFKVYYNIIIIIIIIIIITLLYMYICVLASLVTSINVGALGKYGRIVYF